MDSPAGPPIPAIILLTPPLRGTHLAALCATSVFGPPRGSAFLRGCANISIGNVTISRLITVPGRPVANDGEVAQKAMQIDNGFLRGDAKQGVNKGTLTEYIVSSASGPAYGESPHFGPISQFAMHRYRGAKRVPFKRRFAAAGSGVRFHHGQKCGCTLRARIRRDWRHICQLWFRSRACCQFPAQPRRIHPLISLWMPGAVSGSMNLLLRRQKSIDSPVTGGSTTESC